MQKTAYLNAQHEIETDDGDAEGKNPLGILHELSDCTFLQSHSLPEPAVVLAVRGDMLPFSCA